MRESIKPEDIREGDLIRAEFAIPTEDGFRAVEFVAEYECENYGSASGHYLLERPRPAAVISWAALDELRMNADCSGPLSCLRNHVDDFLAAVDAANGDPR